MTDVQSWVLDERGGEGHLGENDTALKLEDYMAAQEVAETERRQCSNLLIAGGARLSGPC